MQNRSDLKVIKLLFFFLVMSQISGFSLVGDDSVAVSDQSVNGDLSLSLENFL
jgi:hypothetical protein